MWFASQTTLSAISFQPSAFGFWLKADG